MVGSIMLGDDNAAAKWESPASRRWSPDGQILFLGYRILSLDHDYLHNMTVLLSLFGCIFGLRQHPENASVQIVTSPLIKENAD